MTLERRKELELLTLKAKKELEKTKANAIEKMLTHPSLAQDFSKNAFKIV